MLTLSVRGRVDRSVADATATMAAARRAIESYAEELAPTFEESSTSLFVSLHPFAEPVELSFGLDGVVDVLARTFSAGPGYHQYVVELLRALAEPLSIAWAARSDPAGFFERGDRDLLVSELESSLAATARQILELADGGATGFSLLLPQGVEFAHDGLVATPLGPRDRAWVEAVARTPALAADAFPWWEPGLSASYFRGLAIALLETEVRFRKPVDERERRVLERVVTSLERAHGLDPQLPLPWAEAGELYEWLGEESLRATRAGVLAERARRDLARRPLGYRRRAVRVTLSGGWSLVVPGTLAERWEEHGTWVGWDATRTLWVSSMTAETDSTTEATLAGLPELPGDGELLVMERGPIRGHARFGAGEEDGKPVTVLRAHAVVGPHVALGTLVLADEGDRAWALETWGSLDR